MSSVLKPDEQDDGLEAAVDQAVAVCRRRYARGYSRAGRCEPFSGIGDLGIEESRLARLRARTISDLHGIVGFGEVAMKRPDSHFLMTGDQAPPCQIMSESKR